jgi:uncharacterized membrane protein
MSIEQGKSLASVGALLLVIGSFIPFLGIVGFILLMIGLKNLSDYYKDRGIFNNALYGVLFGIIGVAAAAFILIAVFFGGMLFGFQYGPGEDITGITGNVVAFFGGILIAVVVAFIFYILMALYLKRSFDSLAHMSGIGMFRTAGLLLLIGAILTIILIGLVLIFVAWILLTVAFFQMPSAPPPAAQAAPV